MTGSYWSISRSTAFTRSRRERPQINSVASTLFLRSESVLTFPGCRAHLLKNMFGPSMVRGMSIRTGPDYDTKSIPLIHPMTPKNRVTSPGFPTVLQKQNRQHSNFEARSWLTALPETDPPSSLCRLLTDRYSLL